MKNINGKKRSFPARRPGIPGRDPEIGQQPGSTLVVSGRFVKAGRPGKQGRFLFGAGIAVSFETLRTEVERVGLALPRERRLDSALCFPSRHGLGVAWTGVVNHPPKAPGLGLVAPLLGQNGEVPQGEVAADALVDATKLFGPLRCCSGITPERRGSLPMSLLPLRDCGFAGRNSVMSPFPSRIHWFLLASGSNDSRSMNSSLNIRGRPFSRYVTPRRPVNSRTRGSS